MKQGYRMIEAVGYIDPDLVEAAAVDAQPKPRRKLRLLLPAACAILATIGVALAADTLGGFKLLQFFSGEFIGRNTAMSGYTIRFDQVKHFTQRDFTAEAWALGQASMETDPETGLNRSFESWADAQDFLGITLPSIPVLDAAVPREVYGTERILHNAAGQEYPLLEQTHCLARFDGNSDGLTQVFLQAAYWLDDAEITLDATLLTELNQLSQPDMLFAYRGTEPVSSYYPYAAAGGVEAVLLPLPEFLKKQGWTAHFIQNGVIFHLTASHPDGQLARACLEQILDGIIASP